MSINLYDRTLWEDISNYSEFSTIFHTWNWTELISSQYNFKPIAFIKNTCNKNELYGIQFCEIKDFYGRKKLVSLPFSDNCDILFNNNEILEELIDETIDYSRKNNIAEIEIRSEVNSSNLSFTQVTDSVIHKLKLERDYNLNYKYFKDSHIRGINKGKKEKINSEISVTVDSLNQFYNLHLISRKRQGIPIQPKLFFKLFLEKIILNNLGFIVLVRKGINPIAGAIFAGFNKTLTYKYGASNPDYLKLRPNNMLFETAIKEAIERRYQFFDFGKTDINNQGLRRFKSGWGAVEKPLYYSYYPQYKPNKLMKFATDKIVKPLIQFSPKFVCRGIGEMFYKYMG